MLISECFFVFVMIVLAVISSYYSQLKYTRVFVPASVFERAINELLELLSQREVYLKTDLGVAEFLKRYDDWEEFIRQIPEPHNNGLTVFEGKS